MFKFIGKTAIGLVGTIGLLTVGFLTGSALICYAVGDTTEFGEDLIKDCREFKELVDKKHVKPYKKKQLHKEAEKIKERDRENPNVNVDCNDCEQG